MKYLAILSALIFVSCVSTYQQQRIVDSEIKLDRGKGVYISVPEDGWYGNSHYRRSGQMTANALQSEFYKYTSEVYVSANCHGNNCFEHIYKDKYSYYVWPEILHWEDRATEWSGKSDIVEVMIKIYDVKTKQEISGVSLKGKSKWATFGGDHPQDLLPEPISKYLQTIY